MRPAYQPPRWQTGLRLRLNGDQRRQPSWATLAGGRDQWTRWASERYRVSGARPQPEPDAVRRRPPSAAAPASRRSSRRFVAQDAKARLRRARRPQLRRPAVRLDATRCAANSRCVASPMPGQRRTSRDRGPAVAPRASGSRAPPPTTEVREASPRPCLRPPVRRRWPDHQATILPRILRPTWHQPLPSPSRRAGFVIGYSELRHLLCGFASSLCRRATRPAWYQRCTELVEVSRSAAISSKASSPQIRATIVSR